MGRAPMPSGRVVSRSLRIAAALAAACAVGLGGCKTTYTEADIEAAEAKRDREIREQDVTEQEQGTNPNLFEAEREWIDEETER